MAEISEMLQLTPTAKVSSMFDRRADLVAPNEVVIAQSNVDFARLIFPNGLPVVVYQTITGQITRYQNSGVEYQHIQTWVTALGALLDEYLSQGTCSMGGRGNMSSRDADVTIAISDTPQFESSI